MSKFGEVVVGAPKRTRDAILVALATTPDDLLPWLAAWTGMTLDPSQPRERQRALLRHAVALHGVQGTARGIELAVEAVFGLRAEVSETGAVVWSLDSGAPLPGQPEQAFVVQVVPTEGQAVDEQREVDVAALGAPTLAVGLDRGELVLEQHLGLEQQAADDRALAVVDAAAGDEAQQLLVLLLSKP